VLVCLRVFACVFVSVCVHSKKDLIFRYSASVKLTEENELEAASKDPVGAFGHSCSPFVICIFPTCVCFS